MKDLLNLVTPATADALVAELDRVFPDRAPERRETYEDLMYRAGQRSVVEWAKDLIEQKPDEELR